MTDVSSPTSRAARIGVLDVIRFVLELVAFVTLAVWGALSWEFPWSIVAGIAAPAAGALLWALFVSPKAVIRLDTFGKAVVEIIVMMAAALAWWQLGFLVVALVFAAAATTVGILNGRRELDSDSA